MLCRRDYPGLSKCRPYGGKYVCICGKIKMIKAVWLDEFDPIKHSVFCTCKECMKNVKVGSTLRIKMPEGYQAKEIKMTREEAIKKFDCAFEGAFGGGYGAQQIAGLEALGLIKFEEDRKLTAFDIIYNHPDFQGGRRAAERLTRALMDNGILKD